MSLYDMLSDASFLALLFAMLCQLVATVWGAATLVQRFKGSQELQERTIAHLERVEERFAGEVKGLHKGVTDLQIRTAVLEHMKRDDREDEQQP